MVVFAGAIIIIAGIIFGILTFGDGQLFEFIGYLKDSLGVVNSVLDCSPQIISQFIYFLIFFAIIAFIIKLIPFIGS